MEKETKAVDQMTVEELQALLEKKVKNQIAQKKKEREGYEKFVDESASEIVRNAINLNKQLAEFKANSVEMLNTMRDKLNEYGAIRANSKGGFLVRTKDGQYKLLYKFSSICDWDERADKGEALLRDFLSDVIKKRDKDLFELILGLLEKNKQGKLEFSRMQALYSREHLFKDPRWVEAIRLFKESFRVVDSKMRLEFHRRDEATKQWIPISLNLSTI